MRSVLPGKVSAAYILPCLTPSTTLSKGICADNEETWNMAKQLNYNVSGNSLSRSKSDMSQKVNTYNTTDSVNCCLYINNVSSNTEISSVCPTIQNDRL